MGGKQSTTSNQSQQSQSEPWGPTQGLLKDIVGTIQGQLPGIASTQPEQNAYSNLMSNFAAVPSYGGQAQQLANDLLAGGSNRAGPLTGALGQFTNALSPYLSASYLDPTQTPGLQNVLGTIRNDVTNSINSMFAGAGRDLSGKNQYSLARGLSAGLAAPLLNQYNANVAAQQGAANSLIGGTGQASGILSGLDQTALGNRALGLDTALNSVPVASSGGAYGLLNTAQMQRATPLQNLGLLSALTVPIAGLGGQTSSTGQSQSTTSLPWWSPLNSIANVLKVL